MTIAVLGSHGAGKTTLIKSLMDIEITDTITARPNVGF